GLDLHERGGGSGGARRRRGADRSRAVRRRSDGGDRAHLRAAYGRREPAVLQRLGALRGRAGAGSAGARGQRACARSPARPHSARRASPASHFGSSTISAGTSRIAPSASTIMSTERSRLISAEKRRLEIGIQNAMPTTSVDAVKVIAMPVVPIAW